jgi:hypothetical protein
MLFPVRDSLTERRGRGAAVAHRVRSYRKGVPRQDRAPQGNSVSLWVRSPYETRSSSRTSHRYAGPVSLAPTCFFVGAHPVRDSRTERLHREPAVAHRVRSYFVRARCSSSRGSRGRDRPDQRAGDWQLGIWRPFVSLLLFSALDRGSHDPRPNLAGRNRGALR